MGEHSIQFEHPRLDRNRKDRPQIEEVLVSTTFTIGDCIQLYPKAVHKNRHFRDIERRKHHENANIKQF